VINANNPFEYSKAADLLNQSECSVVSLQHEYRIFGGDWGKHILEFTKSQQKPLVTTFHTVLSDLPQLARKIFVDYGADDRRIGVATADVSDLLALFEGKMRRSMSILGDAS
jgi:hypothetical protein